MKEIFRKNQILTIPNLLSLFRICLIPFIVFFYSFEKNYVATIIIIALSAITDIVDGYIARHFNMVSDFGKALDPLADKLTQAALLLCLVFKYNVILIVIIIFAFCEILKFILAFLAAKKYDVVISARWYGKVNTVFIYATMLALIVFPEMDLTLAYILMIVCASIIVISHLLYFRLYINILLSKSKEQSEQLN